MRDGVSYVTVIGLDADKITFERDRGRIENPRINGRPATREALALALARARV